MEKIKLEVIGITYSQTQTDTYALVLEDCRTKKQLPILIGHAEAQSIAIALEGIVPPRPLAHDLFRGFAGCFNISLIEVIIVKLVDGVFYSQLVFTDGNKIAEIDSRTSDAIALALRFECPVYAYEPVMQAARDVENDFKEDKQQSHNSVGDPPPLGGSADFDYSFFSYDELEEQLKEAIEEEDYEKASKLRDELNKRK